MRYRHNFMRENRPNFTGEINRWEQSFFVTGKVRDYNCQNSNYIAVTYPSHSVVTALVERVTCWHWCHSINICRQIFYESIIRWIKFWELAKQVELHFFRKPVRLQKQYSEVNSNVANDFWHKVIKINVLLL